MDRIEVTSVMRLLLTVPVSMAGFLCVSARAVVQMVDGPAETLYGFPLFWIKAGPTSLSTVIDAGAAAIDLVVYGLIVFGLVVAVGRWRPRMLESRVMRWCAWCAAVLVIGVAGSPLMLDPGLGGVTFDPAFHWSSVEQYSVYVGPLARR